MTVVRCFMVEETDTVVAWLRRHARAEGGCPMMPGDYSYHSAAVSIGTLPVRFGLRDGRRVMENVPVEEYDGDPRWAQVAACACGYRFTDEDPWQVLTHQLWEGPGGERRLLPGFASEYPAWGPGAMWDAWWLHDWPRFTGTDGRSLVVVCPDGAQWTIDGQASNCTRPGEDHDCWCRHGEPPLITVDKTPEPGRSTCQAGGGSIATKGYHGFLRDGCFTGSL